MKRKDVTGKASLWQEMLEYEKQTQMTEEERHALHEWVLDGNSVYENSSMGTDETGRPLAFLDVYRYEKEIRDTLEKLDAKGRENYLARLRGEDTIDNLREDLQETHFRLDACERILRKHGLIQEALELMELWRTEPVKVPETTDELPFD